MRVLAIRGRNLASLEGEFSIDFTEEPLASAGIFAISGPTGAGKSTLLDAMCLALFSRTPRTELAKENNVRLRDVQEDVLPQSDPRFLLRRGTASGYAEVDFVALNGCRYRARWSVSRAREKESGRLQAARLTLYNIDAGKEEPGTNKDLQARIIELIGLTFDQFTRSVLLAQNDFSTFLKAEQGEKASLLEKLTGTEQYSEISRRIFAKNAEAKEAYEQLYARVQDIELLSEEEVEASQTRLSALEVEQYRGGTEQIKKDLAETSGLLSARRQELDNWMVAYQENSEGKTLEESLSEMTAQKSECSFRLRTHEENKRKIAGFQQELSERRAMSERWAKLNELAGSADGAKFRRIAQGYTLDVLLSYANVQLRQLSRRYRLERVPDTLALQVIDQDMCDEIRTVHSLSGGESFLVSLALALGLSSLSSNRMKVESLFIDEGFGSLDAETLRVAMDALESLRTQGRKIGVISHVQEMTERIPVQIRVNRAGNGRSYLEVI